MAPIMRVQCPHPCRWHTCFSRPLCALLLVPLTVCVYFIAASGIALPLTARRALPEHAPSGARSLNEGCWRTCDNGSCKDGEADACALRNVFIDLIAKPTEFVLSGTHHNLSTLAGPPQPFAVVRTSQPVLGRLRASFTITGTTVLIVNYQQHIPHFAEGLFAFLSGMQASDRLCGPGACNLLFHQLAPWSERETQTDPIAWHTAILEVVKAMRPGKLFILNNHLYNMIGDGGTLTQKDVRPVSGLVVFERLVYLRHAPGRRWFTVSSACQAFRSTALKMYGVQQDQRTEAPDRPVLPPLSTVGLLLRRGSRSIFNSDAVAELLEKRFGQKVIQFAFENTQLEQQMGFMSGLKLLVAPHGAGLTNLVFLPRGAALVEIFPIHWHPVDYFDGLAHSCGVWHAAYDNVDAGAAVLDSDCAARFPASKLGPECGSDTACVWCAKQSSTVVDLEKLDALLEQAQKHLNNTKFKNA